MDRQIGSRLRVDEPRNNGGENANYDLVCFLAQQSVEKSLKALLCELSISFPKTHDLNSLSALLPPACQFPATFCASLSKLDRYAVEFRYPGTSATADLAREAVEHATTLYQWCRAALNR
ncbi:MAG: HEPN domain-containing protein [Verrucomicrobia bacterium]|nr:HEPN domain-containing protein [Verrucomicrobiota bacterium]